MTNKSKMLNWYCNLKSLGFSYVDTANLFHMLLESWLVNSVYVLKINVLSKLTVIPHDFKDFLSMGFISVLEEGIGR